MYTSYRLRKGHRVGVCLAGADSKHFLSSVPPGGRTLTLHCGPGALSALLLPGYGDAAAFGAAEPEPEPEPEAGAAARQPA